MNTFEAIIMGLVQGLTEFLPISSSAHLRILGSIFGEDPGAAFTAITQIGTETAVLIYFRKDISRILGKWFQAFVPARTGVNQSDSDVRMGWMIIVGSLPIGILGLLGQDWIEKEFRNMWITVAMLVIFALFLGAADRWGKKEKTLDHLSWGQAILFGFAQALALVPGVSRSGGTITAGRLMGFTRVAAARYSFLLAMPAVFASGFYEAAKSVGNNPVGWGATILATVVAFVVGYAVIVWFMRLLETKTFAPFVIYRLLLGIVVGISLAVGALSAFA
ncbi:undecaprenyl-diphosphate phosphatase [Varibaculum vaginae]|uniref:undecaprenyl-diphosphate phosphatase n=1 Tax=Varibaculum vaginae TaxID=2364797 RepID=UPI000F091552|nr:undecaprenyl-diphosphate phosphatase [Varibaculum vaginae]